MFTFTTYFVPHCFRTWLLDETLYSKIAIFRPTFHGISQKDCNLPIYNIHLHIKQQHVDPVQSLILLLNYLSLLADSIMSGSVFQRMLPLNLREFNPYLTVFVLGS